MNDSRDVDNALQRVRDAFEDAADEAGDMSDKAKREVQDAIDDLEQRVEQLRK